jgi:hypothetical protein
VEWCALVCRGGGTTDPTAGVWRAAGRPARLFPDAITLRGGVAAGHLAEALSGRKGCSVKDSYADVDLAPYGFRELFNAQWFGQFAPLRWAHGSRAIIVS